MVVTGRKDDTSEADAYEECGDDCASENENGFLIHRTE